MPASSSAKRVQLCSSVLRSRGYVRRFGDRLEPRQHVCDVKLRFHYDALDVRALPNDRQHKNCRERW